jgi:Trk K+ transport system NAD-binding subunit
LRTNWRRTLRAQLRDARVLLLESRTSFILLLLVIAGGALVLRFLYLDPVTGRHLAIGQALYAALSLVFFNPVLPYPSEWHLQLAFFAIPILGLAAGADTVISVGSALMSKQGRAQKWQVAMASTYSDHIVICGMGKVGYRVAQELTKFGRDVVGVEINGAGRFVDKALALGTPLIVADARNSETLVKAGVPRADAIVPCAADELTNLDISLEAHELNPGIKVVMRMFDPDLARRVQKGFGIRTAFSTSALAAPIFAAAAMRVNVKHSFYLGDTLLSLSELVIAPQSQLLGWSVQRLEQELDLSVVCSRSGSCPDLHPRPDLQLGTGDRIIVMATLDALCRLQELNG